MSFKKSMQGIKYLIRDYENTQGNRLVDFRRHLNSFIQGGVKSFAPYATQLKERAEKEKERYAIHKKRKHDEISNLTM